MLKKGISGLFLAVLMAVGFSGCSTVETGHVGVESVFGKTKMAELEPGLYQSVTRKITVVSTRETTVAIDNVHPKTKDNVTMQDFDIDIRYAIEPNKVAETLSTLAGDLTVNADGDQVVGERYVKRHALEAIYSIAAKYNSSEIYLKREQISAEVTDSLQKSLNKDMSGTFTIPGATVRSLVTDKNLESSITRAAQIQFDISRKQEELKLAQAEADVVRTRASAQADANRIISGSLTPMLIRKFEIEAQRSFATQGTHTVLLPSGGATPLINVNK